MGLAKLEIGDRLKQKAVLEVGLDRFFSEKASSKIQAGEVSRYGYYHDIARRF